MTTSRTNESQTLTSLVDSLSQTNLSPSPSVNRLFSQLVQMCMNEQLEYDDELQARIRLIAATGETKLEIEWAKKIIENPSSLDAFPYINNYRELVAHEYEALLKAGALPNTHWAFVGSGPLPLTSILFEKLGVERITNVDSQLTSLRLGEQVTNVVNGASRVRMHTNVSAIAADYSTFDVVIVAALVGGEAEKTAILTRIAKHSKPGAIIAARSVPADGRQLLYPRVTDIPDGLTLVSETVPPADVVNSLVIMKRQ